MKPSIKSVSAAAGIALSAILAAPADAYTITLQPLKAQIQTAATIVVENCRVSDRNPAVDGTAFFEMPTIAAEQGITGTSTVMIRLSSAGKLVSESVFGTSGNAYLDRAALLSARLTSFTPEVRNCAAVGGSYLYSVEF